MAAGKSATPKKRIEYKGKIVDSQGTVTWRSFYGKTKKEARTKYEEYKRTHEQIAIAQGLGVFLKPDNDMSFETWARKWLNEYIYGNVRDITFESSYEIPVCKHLIPYFGNLYLADIRPSTVQAFFKEHRNDSYSKQHKLLVRLKGIFKAAVENDIIAKSPVVGIKLPKSASDLETEKRAYSYEQARILIDYAKTQPFGLSVILLLKAGLRRSELLALPFEVSKEHGGIDLDDNMIYVRQSISESKYGISFEKCKTKESIRDIPIDDETRKLIFSLPDQVQGAKKTMHSAQYIICNTMGNYCRPSNWKGSYDRFMNGFHSYCQEHHLDIPILNPHELRHSFGSILYSRGVDIVTISKLMGHSNIDITVKLYVHDDMQLKRNAVSMLSDMQ